MDYAKTKMNLGNLAIISCVYAIFIFLVWPKSQKIESAGAEKAVEVVVIDPSTRGVNPPTKNPNLLTAREKQRLQDEARRRETEELARRTAARELAVIEKKKKEDTLNRLRPRMRIVTDRHQGVDWVYHRSTNTNNTGLHLYFSKPIGREHTTNQPIRVLFNYQGKSWLFIERISVLPDGQPQKVLAFPYFDVERDSFSGGIREWVDLHTNSDQVRLSDVRRWVSANRIDIRFYGKQYHDDHVINRGTINHMREVLEFWDAMQPLALEHRIALQSE